MKILPYALSAAVVILVGVNLYSFFGHPINLWFSSTTEVTVIDREDQLNRLRLAREKLEREIGDAEESRDISRFISRMAVLQNEGVLGNDEVRAMFDNLASEASSPIVSDAIEEYIDVQNEVIATNSSTESSSEDNTNNIEGGIYLIISALFTFVILVFAMQVARDRNLPQIERRWGYVVITGVLSVWGGVTIAIPTGFF